MSAGTPSILAAIAGYGVFLWLGLYLLLRGGLRTPLIRVAVAGLLAQSTFFFASAWTDAVTDPVRNLLLERWTWWTAVLPLAIWFHLSSLMARGIQRPDRREAFVPGRAIGGYALALVLIALGTATNLFNAYEHAAVGVQAGPAYGVYVLFQVLMTIGALFNFVQARRVLVRRAADREVLRQLTLLIGGSLPFALGGLWLGLRFMFALPIAELPGYLLLFAGIVPLGYSVANYGLLLEGQNVQRDFFYTFTGITLLNIIYTLLIGLTTDIRVGGVLALVTLVTLTHTAFDSGRSWLDRLFFNRAEQQARAEAREFATALGSNPVAPLIEDSPTAVAPVEPATEAEETTDASSQKTFKNDVRKALTGLKSPPRLVNSPLLTLNAVSQELAAQELLDNRLNRVSALRDVLIEQIEGLRPNDRAGPRVGEAWRFYNVLYYPYVRELSRKGALAEARRLREERQRNGVRQPGDLEQVLEWLADVDEDTFYKWQRRASDTIAEALWASEG